MNSFETLNEDEVYYFSYINENIEYLEKLFNRKIEFYIGALLNSSFYVINENTISIKCDNDDNHIFGLIFKLKNNELNKLIQIYDKEYSSHYFLTEYDFQIYYPNNFNSESIKSYIFLVNSYTITKSSIPFEEMELKFSDKNHICINKIYKLLHECFNLYKKRYINCSIKNGMLYKKFELYMYSLCLYYDDNNELKKIRI